jgi:microcystin-dependent protein
MCAEFFNTLPFETGDDSSGGTIVYRLAFVPQIWMLQAIMAALVLLTDPNNWNDVGTITPQEAAQLSIAMVEGFNPMVSGPGIIYPYAGFALPANALWCDGSSYLRTDYPALFAVIGVTYGSVDADHFTMPNLAYRVPVGIGTYSGQPEIELGTELGEPEHTLTVAELAAHQHSIDGYVPGAALAPGELPVFTTVTVPSGTGFTGSDNPHNNMQPSLGVNYIISTS